MFLFIIFPTLILPAKLRYDEKDLLLQVAGGDETAFRQLFDGYSPNIYSLAMHITRSEVLAEEIVQDVFIKVWEKREDLREVNFFNAWLRTVAKNTCSNYLRNLAIEKIALYHYKEQGQSSSASTPENEVATKQYQGMIDAAIRQLSPQQRKVYLLSRQSGRKQDEIARELSISIYTVKEYLKLAQRSIKSYLESRIDTTLFLLLALYLK